MARARRWPLCLLLAVAACAQAAPPRPLLWKVSDGDNHLYLLGSFHALQAGDYPLAPEVDAAFADAERVAFEIAPEEMNSPELPRRMMAAARLPAGKTLRQTLSARHWRQLGAYSSAHGLDLDSYQRFEPWFVSLVISLQQMRALGFDGSLGLDRQLMDRAARAGKPTLGLETGAEQIAALDSMSPTEQEQALAESLDEAKDFEERMERLHALWRRGDDATLYSELAVDFRRQYPQLYQRVNVDRNQAWLPRLRRLLDDEHRDDTLVVVGSLHLLGAEGLVAQLKANGYRVERL